MDIKPCFSLEINHKQLYEFREKLKEIIEFSKSFNVENIFDSFGHRTMQVALATGLKLLPKNSGNDLMDADNREYELKTININSSQAYFAGVRISENTLKRFRSVTWLFAEFDGSFLQTIYRVDPINLEYFFSSWENKIQNKTIIIDQKISASKIRKIGELIFSFDKMAGANCNDQLPLGSKPSVQEPLHQAPV